MNVNESKVTLYLPPKKLASVKMPPLTCKAHVTTNSPYTCDWFSMKSISRQLPCFIKDEYVWNVSYL